MVNQFSSKKILPELEHEVLDFWDKNDIFEKSIKARQGAKLFNFYDGPPFATGQAHYGHILATTIKDSVTRYKTMRGFLVARRVGWDCHGLPIENLIEKDLKIKSKKVIEEEIGIEKFNDACRASVFSCVADFSTTLKRVGRWANYEDSYATMDPSYTESVWWVFKQLWDAGLVYKDYRVSAYCPRCGTTISNFEVNQGYKEANDPSIFIKFPISGKTDEYFLVWTTTPWTLPANVALAVNAKIKYVKVEINKEKLILAKERLDVLEGEYRIIEEFEGKKLQGVPYDAFYSFIKPDKKSHFLVLADFVSVEEGTGVVHVAPAFGVDDLNVSKENDLSVLMTINNEGKFLPEIKSLAGKFVKDADGEIIKELQGRGLILRSDRVRHSYPFCWRCDSPLIYMALDSWYIRVTDFKEDLVKVNQEINWQPKYIKDGRFGKWLGQARDWDFARTRYWGAPLPIWQCEQCEKKIAVSSRQEILSKVVGSGKLIFVRHGEAEQNVKSICNGDIKNNKYHLTDRGVNDAKELAEKLSKEKIDIIFSSDFLRTRETAEIISKGCEAEIIFDERLREINIGEFEGGSVADSRAFRDPKSDYYNVVFPKGESLAEVGKRMSDFIVEITNKYAGKNILVVSHQDPIKTAFVYFGQTNPKKVQSLESLISVGSHHTFFFNNEVDLSDLHRPYIDKIEFQCGCKGKMKRTNEVFDCWFESGSMPYAQWHYPFENKELVESTFPADFIAEGMDQTRGWFYTLTVLAIALTKKDLGLGKNQPAFKNVIVNGTILAENGQKLSKRLKNYPAPSLIFEKYGADAMRFFLMSSTAIGDDYLLSEKRLQEAWRRTIITLWNVYLFFDSYKNGESTSQISAPESNNLLDKWIISRINHHSELMIKHMDDYDLTHASRIIIDLADELSNWYVRRSRRRFQKDENPSDKKVAIETLGYVLQKTCLMTAPFMPFISEVIYKNIGGDKESVHLADFPIAETNLINNELEDAVARAREIISSGLAIRAELKIKVRQPLAEVRVKNKDKVLEDNKEILQQICEELNVKKVIFGAKIEKEIEFDLELTAELREEGIVREIGRQIQSLRKRNGFSVGDKINIEYACGDKELAMVIEKNSKQILVEVGAINISLALKELKDEIEVDKKKIRIEALPRG
ncbi:MAG: isoleucine--tRNA ligase [Candidatus Portnoybacteria bacterium CG10_big_fil_rev_8_21_14_0_10_36_7]|uniref:Isoleucine--tRNA ligase n=1 Tax=Candidatus Portnoybacteria bacterium CG10_big_fil_rev_8_21_14_0_10_36_7 TaxID=1974812 RepID=A0A2M8KD85_9BACT|nr:MAG: isoleucine--tRNA ligase [Candidatus Portnoybacteria bacterium CG10_big_fil_rev_8_21_14_0_10_36_7]